ncbi:MAG: hypothetical protein ACYCPQ_02555 [Elusimicrobiota bacterium]
MPPSRPRPIHAWQRINPGVDPAQAIHAPRLGPHGNLITQRPLRNDNGQVVAPRRDDRDIMDNDGYLNRVRDWDDRDGDRDGYDWHRFGSYWACHHYDADDGIHWWGWYVEDSYFWTPFYSGFWWWYDPYWHRWLFLNNGGWWYQDSDVLYIYNDGSYFLYNNSNGGTVAVPDQTPPEDNPPQGWSEPGQDNKTYYSADGTRMVAIAGAEDRAFLYDTTTPPAFKPVWLGDGIQDVRFQNDDSGRLSQILVLTANNSFQVYDRDGNPADQSSSAAQPQINDYSGGSTSLSALKTITGGYSW